MLRHVFTLMVSGLVFLIPAKSQVKGVPEKAIIMKVGVGANAGIADLGKRFPVFATMPAELYFKTPKNLTFGIAYSPLLGNRVKIDSLYGGIVGPSQLIFDKNGFPGLIRYYMRGFTLQATAGKIFPLNEKWVHSGIEFRMGAGIMQHYIKARFDAGSIPQISDEYKAGYDRLTNGLCISETVNFHYLNTETVSFFAGISLGQAFTKNRRSWDYSTMKKDETLRKDLYLGLQAGVLIPVSLKGSASTDYYD